MRATLLFAAVDHEGRAYEVHSGARETAPGPHEFFLEDELLDLRQPEAAILPRPGGGEPATRREPLLESRCAVILALRALGRLLEKYLPDTFPECFVGLAELELHVLPR